VGTQLQPLIQIILLLLLLHLGLATIQTYHSSKYLVQLKEIGNMYLSSIYSVNTGFNEINTTVIDAIFNVLSSTASISAYNAAAVGNWVNVTAGEYGKAVSTIPGASTYVMPTSSIGLGTSAAWGGNYATTVLSANAQIPANTYIIGFVSRAYSTAANAVPLLSYTFEGTYTEIASSAHVTSTNTYFVRKAPTNSLSAVGYVALIGDQNMAATNAIASFNYAYSNNITGTLSGGNYAVNPTWTANSSTPMFFQVVGTTQRNW